MAKDLATWAGEEGKFTAYSFCHSAATALAESEISIVALCHAGC